MLKARMQKVLNEFASADDYDYFDFADFFASYVGRGGGSYFWEWGAYDDGVDYEDDEF